MLSQVIGPFLLLWTSIPEKWEGFCNAISLWGEHAERISAKSASRVPAMQGNKCSQDLYSLPKFGSVWYLCQGQIYLGFFA